MESILTNNKRIAKNTLMLYIRMLVLMFISLYTSRVVLSTLGVIDFGIYNVVGGLVVMLGFLSGSMANAAQRFLSYELGKNNTEKVNSVFSLCVIAHAGIALLVVIILEAIAPWFVQTQMTIPEERMEAAHWVLQFSIFSTVLTITQVPYNAIIISKERMDIYAYIGIVEAVLKLVIVYMLLCWSFDKLKLYAFLHFTVTFLITFSYRIYCSINFSEAKFKFYWDKKLLREITSFAGWNMLGEIAWAFTGQGVNIILNFFCGPAINAARAIAEQVNSAVSRFVNGFQTAMNPQIIKTYAVQQWKETKQLVYRGARFSFYLLLLLSLPIILEMEFVLNLWLKEVPDYTTQFCQLILINSLVAIISNNLAQVAKAYGKIKNYQITVSFMLFLNFPLSFGALWIGASPISTLFVSIGIQISLVFIRIYLIRKMIPLSYGEFYFEVCKPIIIVSLSSSIIPVIMKCLLEGGWFRLLFELFVSALSVSVCSYYLGITKKERIYIKSIPEKILKKSNKV